MAIIMLRFIALICLFAATCQADEGYDYTAESIADGFAEARRQLAEEKAQTNPDPQTIKEIEQILMLDEPECEWPTLGAISFVGGEGSLKGLFLDEANKALTQNCERQIKNGQIIEKHHATVGESNAKLAESVSQVIVQDLLGRDWSVEQLHSILWPRLLFPKLGSLEQMQLVYEELGRQLGKSSQLGERLVKEHLLKACDAYSEEHRFQFFGQSNFDQSFSPKALQIENPVLERQFYLSWATELICDYIVLRGEDE